METVEDKVYTLLYLSIIIVSSLYYLYSYNQDIEIYKKIQSSQSQKKHHKC